MTNNRLTCGGVVVIHVVMALFNTYFLLYVLALVSKALLFRKWSGH